MFLKPGFEAEYEKRHNAIWPELKKLLQDAGVCDYSIFWDKETNILFAVQKIRNRNNELNHKNKKCIIPKFIITKKH
jgi:L-rhamnose mutarotase